MNLDKTLAHLVTYKTFDGNEKKSSEASKLYKWFLSQLPDGYKSQIIKSGDSQSLLVAKNLKKQYKIILQSHIDVVPADDAQFNAYEKDGKLYGRGVSDMKFAAATYLHLLQELKDVNIDLAVCLTDDEEIGGFNGIDYLLNTYDLKCDVCFLPDGGNNNVLITDAKGVLHFKIISQGKSAHGSMPWLGVNAIEKIIKSINEIKILEFFNTNDSKDNWYNTFNVGQIKGGISTNTVADYAEVKCDVRLINNDLFNPVIDQIKTIVQKNDCQLEILISGDAYNLDKNNVYVKKFIESLKNSKVAYTDGKDHGSSDARFFVSHNIPVILFKPNSGGDHSENEWIDIKSLEEFYIVLKDFILTFI